MSSLQVNVFQLKPLQAVFNGGRYVLDIRVDLCRHEEFFSSHLALLDRMADLLLSIVDLGGIQMIVPQFDGGLDGVDESTIDAAVVGALVPCGAGCVRVVSFVSDEGRKVRLTAIADLGMLVNRCYPNQARESNVPSV